MELNYYIDSDLSAVRVASANLSLFENTWVEVTETIKIDNVSGAYSMVIKNVATGVTLLSYSNNNMLTIRKDNQFIRPKWGIYRSLLNPQDLRDEIVHFASFSIYEEKPTAVLVPAQDSNNLLVSSLPNGSASIEYVLDYPSKVTLQLLGMDGKVLESFADNQFQQPGQHTVILSGNEFPGKTGLVRLITDRGQSVTKVLPTN